MNLELKDFFGLFAYTGMKNKIPMEWTLIIIMNGLMITYATFTYVSYKI